MSGNGNDILDKALAKLAQQQAEVAKTKHFINQALEFDGKEPMFSAEEIAGAATAAAVVGSLTIKPGQFLGKPLATAVKTVLEMRKEAVEVDDLHAALIRGNFDFGTTDKDAQKRALRISLGKNVVAFRKLPHSDMYGLVEWYGGRARTRGKSADAQGSEVSPAPEPEGLGSEEEAAGDAAAPEADEQKEGK